VLGRSDLESLGVTEQWLAIAARCNKLPAAAPNPGIYRRMWLAMVLQDYVQGDVQGATSAGRCSAAVLQKFRSDTCAWAAALASVCETVHLAPPRRGGAGGSSSLDQGRRCGAAAWGALGTLLKRLCVRVPRAPPRPPPCCGPTPC
jgi:hypothetical protein